MNTPVLAGDIGGTKTALALYNHNRILLRKQTYANRLFASLTDILHDFLSPVQHLPQTACLGVAGPVIDNRAKLTNLDWHINGHELCMSFDFTKIRLVNDLVATAAGVHILPPESLLTINKGCQPPRKTIAVLAPGTGLGQAFAVPRKNRLHTFPSEGGHSSFAPINQQQIDLLNFMLNRKKHVSVEQVCSGKAIPDLFSFLSLTCSPPAWLRKKLRNSNDQTPKIIQAAVDAATGGTPCETAVQTVELFIDILAAEAANLALKTLATGGMYLGGGLPPRLAVFFDKTRFMKIFCRGIYKDLLADIPVQIILDKNTALTGAREIALLL